MTAFTDPYAYAIGAVCLWMLGIALGGLDQPQELAGMGEPEFSPLGVGADHFPHDDWNTHA